MKKQFFGGKGLISFEACFSSLHLILIPRPFLLSVFTRRQPPCERRIYHNVYSRRWTRSNIPTPGDPRARAQTVAASWLAQGLNLAARGTWCSASEARALAVCPGKRLRGRLLRGRLREAEEEVVVVAVSREGGGGGDGGTAKSPKIVIISGLLPFNFASLYVSYKYLYEAQQGLSGTDPSSLANMYLNHLNMRLHDLQEFSFNQEVLAIMSLDRWTRSMFMLMREYVTSNFSGMLWIGYAMYSAGYEMTFLCQSGKKIQDFQ